MQVFLTGVSCVGKSTIGKILADILGVTFFDLDLEVEAFYNTSIERLQNNFITVHGFRDEGAKVFAHLMRRPDASNCVVAFPPSAMMSGYLRAIRKTSGITVVITDEPENIVERLRFYDIDSKPMVIKDFDEKKKLYLREVRKDITYYRKSYGRARYRVDISGLDPVQAAYRIIGSVAELEGKIPATRPFGVDKGP